MSTNKISPISVVTAAGAKPTSPISRDYFLLGLYFSSSTSPVSDGLITGSSDMLINQLHRNSSGVRPESPLT